MQRYCEHCRKYVEARRAPFSNLLICSVCGTEFGVDYLTAGTIVSGFRIDMEIGRGSFGIVYKALQLNLERMVALKILSDELARDNDFVDNFFREARLAASLSHPNIVQAFDAGATPEGIYYFAMELIEGETLDARIIRAGRVPQETAVDIALKISRALDYAWERQKLTHGDIKPENIIINSSGEPKLADLGLAKTANEDSTGHLMVTPLYAPPEIISGVAAYDPVKSDIYSFGGTFYHMLAGTPPFNEDDPEAVMQMHLNDIPVSLAERVNVHPDLSFITDRMLSKNPDERPRDWKEIIRFLEAVDLRPSQITRSTRRLPLRNIGQLTAGYRRSVIFTMIGLLGIICIVLLGTILYLSYSHRRSGAADANAAAARGSKDYEWNKLKTDIKFLSERKALELVSGYVDSHKDAPTEALQTLESLKRENAQADYRNRIGLDFDKELKEVIQRLKNAELEAMSSNDLLALQARIISLFKMIGENKFLYSRIAAGDKQFLDDKIKTLKEVLVRHDSEARKNWMIKLDSGKREYLDRTRRREREQVAANEEADRFTLAVTALEEMSLKNRNAAAVKRVLGEIGRDKLSNEYRKLLDFILAVYGDDIGLNQGLVRLSGLLKGNELPEPSPFPGYKIATIDDSGIGLESRLDFGVLKKKVKVAQLKSKYKLDMIFDAIAKGGAAKLSAADCDLVLRLFIDYKDSRYTELLDKFYQLSTEQRRNWNRWSGLLTSAAANATVVHLVREAEDNFNAGRYPEFMLTATKLQREYAQNEVTARYAGWLADAREISFCASPEVQARALLKQYEENRSRLAPVARLGMAMTLKSRYGGLKCLPGELRSQIAAVARAECDGLRGKGVDAIEKLLIAPEQYRPGMAWAGVTAWLEKKTVSGPPRKLFQLYAAQDIGDYNAISDIIVGDNAIGDWFVNDKNNPAGFAHVVAVAGVLLDRYGVVAWHGNELNLLRELSRQANPGSDDALICKSSLLWLRQELGMSMDDTILTGVQFSDNANSLTLQLAWLDLYGMLNVMEPDRNALVQKAEYYAGIFSGRPETRDAADLMRLVGRLVNGSCETAEIERMRGKAAPLELFGMRTALSAAAYGLASGRLSREKVLQLIRWWSPLLEDSAAWAQCWESLTVLRLAAAESWFEMQRLVRDALSNSQLQAMPLYPELVLLNEALLQVSGKGNTRMLTVALPLFFRECPLAGVGFGTTTQLTTAVSPVSTVRKMLDGGYIRQGYWSGLMLMISNYYEYERAVQVGAAMGEYRHKLNWEKRQLLDNVNKLLTKLPE